MDIPDGQDLGIALVGVTIAGAFVWQFVQAHAALVLGIALAGVGVYGAIRWWL